MTTKTPKAPGRRRATPPDAAKLYPQVVRWRMVNYEFSEKENPHRQQLFVTLQQVGFTPSRPQGPPGSLSTHQDWWFVALNNEGERELLMKLLKRAQKLKVIDDIQTVRHGDQHPLPVDREMAALIERLRQRQD
ncbi:MAG: hypothetical protein EYC62_03385 [Alphaproteobacteria bacterium]|nr:MAG: hypothetical protein EYC62_03385 [Alphaproteobacteria bacterium]